MNKLFVHHPLFRLLSPLFSGTLVYLLILLVNNNIGQVQEAFLGQELYVCIGLAYLIQEYARLSLVLFERMKLPISYFWRLVVQVTSTLIVGILLVTGAMHAYFKMVLAYTPNTQELVIFNSIFSMITVIYLVLYVSHGFLYRINTDRLAKEVAEKQRIEDDFKEFKREVNPKLLFESLEALLVIMKKDPEEAEQLSDHFSSVYRYILARKNRELVRLSEEMAVLRELIHLLGHLPYRKIEFVTWVDAETWVVPGSLLTIVERIMRTTIPSSTRFLTLNLYETPEVLQLRYEAEEVLRTQFTTETLGDVARNYKFYSDTPLRIVAERPNKTVEIPKLSFDESSTD